MKIGKYSILIDAGLSLRRLESSLAELGVSGEQIDLVFLTHAHGDHSKAIVKFAAKFQKPLYLTRETYHALLARDGDHALPDEQLFFLNKELKLENIKIRIFRLPHSGHREDGRDDAGGNIGFLFKYHKNDEQFSCAYFTDLGVMPEYIHKEIRDCDYYFLEANHDVRWQRVSRRPPQLIERNLGDFGHLSNEQAAEILIKVIVPEKAKRRTKGVMLAHISQECNSHVLAEKIVGDKLAAENITGIDIKIAPEKRLSEYVKIV